MNRPDYVQASSELADEQLQGRILLKNSCLIEACSADSIVNRQPIVTPYRRPKMTPLECPGSWPDAV
jgi:hypothetical protein